MVCHMGKKAGRRALWAEGMTGAKAELCEGGSLFGAQKGDSSMGWGAAVGGSGLRGWGRRAQLYIWPQGVAEGPNAIALLFVQIVFNWTLPGAGLG